MKNLFNAKTFVTVILTLILLTSCDKKSDPNPVDAQKIIGKWQMKTAKLNAKLVINGKEESVSQSANGNSSNIIEFKQDGTISDPSDIFGTSTYTWNYTIKGAELWLGDPDDIGYFTLTTTGNTMIWHMDLQQVRRSLNDTDGFSSIFNVDAADMRNSFKECDFKIEFDRK